MKIDKTVSDDTAILALKGEFDTFHCPKVIEEVEGLVEDGIRHIAFDLSQVTFINSTALGAIVKVYKRCKAEGGELVLAEPGGVVAKIIGQLGIDKLVPMTASVEEAEKHLIKSLNEQELAGNVSVDEGRVMITFPDDTRNKQLHASDRSGRFTGRKVVVGRLSNVDGEQLRFLWSGARYGMSVDEAKQLFFVGSEIEVKFQVKLVKKQHIELLGKVESVEVASDDQVRVTLSFASIDRGDREALRQFAADMRFLRQQVHGDD